MRHHYTTEAKAAAKVSPSGSGIIPPTTKWVDILLDGLFSNPDDAVNSLELFDYEGFLRKEGLV